MKQQGSILDFCSVAWKRNVADITDPDDADQSKKAKEPERKFQQKWKDENVLISFICENICKVQFRSIWSMTQY